MSEREEYTPTMDDLVDGYAYCTGIGPVIGERRRAIAKRAIVAHDKALREQITRGIEAHIDDDGTDEWFAAIELAACIARGEDQTDE